MSVLSTTNDLFQGIGFDVPCGPEGHQKPVVIPQGGFLTFRNSVALPADSVLYFDLTLSEAAE